MKRITTILWIVTLFFASFTHAQQKWTRIYGGTGDDRGNSVQQTSDGGYIIAGYTTSYGAGHDDVYLVKTNALGDTLWTRTYGGSGWDEGNSVQQTSDGGYIVAGYTTSGDADVYLIKTNTTGDTLWTRTYGGNFDDQGYFVQQTTDGGYIITGSTYSYGIGNYLVYLIKTNASGDTLWTRTYGGTRGDWGFSVQQTIDGGYVIAGRTDSFGAGSEDVYLIKTNTSGATLWTKTYGGTNEDEGWSVQQTSDTGYIVAGWTRSFGISYQVYLIKTNAGGDTLWTRTYVGLSGAEGYSVQQTSEGGYIVAGFTGAFPYDVYLIKTNALGDTLWTKTYGGTNSDEGRSVKQTLDGGYIITGYTDSYGNGNPDVYLIKTDANGNIGVEENAEVRGQRVEGRITAKPNPFSSFATLPGHEAERFSLYDVSGRKVGTFRGDRVGEGLAPGVYFVCKGTACRAPTTAPLRIVKVR